MNPNLDWPQHSYICAHICFGNQIFFAVQNQHLFLTWNVLNTFLGVVLSILCYIAKLKSIDQKYTIRFYQCFTFPDILDIVECLDTDM